ncbi:uncharacterized protein LOC128869687 [Anastrepha ludens]|uniref:uncharacterized protein LOC128869687 n=1 Tax=Anastrepha ludens TaxID=28586 RepID=UPI0023B0FC5C|nr:uncharacterized protein LOC128869687 [Anastrepha ludens]
MMRPKIPSRHDIKIALIDFAGARNMIVCSTRFQNKKIHQATLLSPYRKTQNQIDHVVKAGRHASSVLDVCTIRGPKLHTCFCAAKSVQLTIQRMFDIEKLQSQQTARRFATRLSLLLSESTAQQKGMHEQWSIISRSLRTAAEKDIGFRQAQKNGWYDEQCHVPAERKDAAYRTTLRSGATRAMLDRYTELKKEERRIIRQKKREAEIRECEELEMLANRNNARKFYQKVRRLTEGFQTGTFSCKKKDGELVIDIQSNLKLWREHFSNLLNSDSCACHRECEDPDAPIVDDGIVVPLLDHDEVRIAITRLKNNKASGADELPVELFKHVGEELVRCMHQLLYKIWSDESMPADWNLSLRVRSTR